MDKPGAAEFRALPSLGVLGLLQLVQWAATAPNLRLWSNALFLAAFIGLVALTIYGAFGFFTHWKARVIGPGLIVIIYALVAFEQPALYVLVALAVAFVVVAYFVSPDRAASQSPADVRESARPMLPTAPSFDRLATYFSGKQIKVTDLIVEGGAQLISGKTFEDCTLFGPAVLNRDNHSPVLEGCTHSGTTLYIEVQPDAALVGAIRVEGCIFRRCHFVNVGLAALRTELPSEMRPPLLAGSVERFERTDGNYVHEWSMNDLRRELGREPKGDEGINAFLREPEGHWYIAWLTIETLGTPSKANRWVCTVNLKDGGEVPCLLTPRNWGAPKPWPSIKFHSLVEVQSMFLENKTLYNVIVLVRLGQSEGELNMGSFKARFYDDNGAAIECTMREPGTVG